MSSLRMLALTILLAACAPLATEQPVPGEKISWPAIPGQERIQFSHAFSRPDDLGIHESGLRRFWGSLIGRRDQVMVRPYALAIRGRVLAVGDPGAHVLHLFDLARRDYRRIASVDGIALESPVGVALSQAKIFISDSALGKVFILGQDGSASHVIDGLARPTGIAWDEEGKRLFVVETMAHQISAFTPDGRRISSFGKRGTEAGQFNFPSHLYLADGRLWVNDSMNFRVQSFDTSGKHLSTFGEHGDASGQFSQPKGVGVDQSGHIYVAGATIDRVQIFSESGDFLLAFGDHGSQVGAFQMPAGIAVSGDLVYVADSYNRRVQVFQYVGGD